MCGCWRWNTEAIWVFWPRASRASGWTRFSYTGCWKRGTKLQPASSPNRMAQTASFREATSVAADSLRASKLRTFLTLSGIILATTTLIAVMSMIHGMDVYIANTVTSMGSDGFRIVKIAFVGNFDPKKYVLMQKRNPELSPEEFQYLKDHAKLVEDFGMSSGRNVSVSLGSQTLTSVSLNGGTANWGELGDTQVA